MSTFADSSALGKLYADEPGDQEIRRLDALVVSALARVEIPAALWRKTRTGELEDAAARTLIRAFERDFHGDRKSGPRFAVTAVTGQILVAAAREAERYGLRAYDAVQLASALAVREVDPRCRQFACFDTELRRAARSADFIPVPVTD